MKPIKTLILFTILAALAAYVYFYEIQGGEEREKQEAAAEKIIVFEADSVKKIEIRSVFDHFVFERSGSEWRILEPVVTDGDKSAIDGMLTALKNMTRVRQFSIKDGEKKDFGLVGRSTFLNLAYHDGRRDALRFGDDTPVSGNMFISRDDTIVYTVASRLKNNVNKSLFDWRDKSVAVIKESDVREFRLKNTTGIVRLVREGSDWRIVSPKEVRADNISVNALLRKFENGKAKSIVSEEMDNAAQFGLAKPAYEIDLYLGDSRAHKQIILSKLDNNVSNLKDDSRPQVMAVDSLFLKDIDKSFFDLRNKKIAEFDKNATDSVVITQGDSVLHFSKDTSDTWLLGGSQKVYEWKMNAFLNAINTLQAEEFLQEDVASVTRYGLSDPIRTVVCYHEGEPLQRIFLSLDKDRKIAVSPAARIVARISENAWSSLEVKLADYLDTSAAVTAEDEN